MGVLIRTGPHSTVLLNKFVYPETKKEVPLGHRTQTSRVSNAPTLILGEQQHGHFNTPEKE